MTDDDLDLLASAYLDGEATSEEVAMVERDPELLARVEALRSISAQVAVPVTAPSEEVKEQHLAAALAAFGLDADAGTETGTDSSADAVAAPVINMADRANRPSSGRTNRRTNRRTMPRWLPAAAALLLFGGAGALIASQGIGAGGDDSSEAATAAAETEESSDDAGSDEAADLDESTEAMAESRMVEEAGEEEAMEFESDEEAMEDDEAMEDESAADAASESQPVPEESEGGFFPDDPVLTFAAVPNQDEVLRSAAPELRFDVSQSQCADFAAPLTDGSVVGYLPIEVAGEPAELFVLARENDTESAIILALDGCQLVTP